MSMLRIFILCLTTALLLSRCPVCHAQSRIMIIRIEGDKIVLNKGAGDALTPNQELYVHRIGKPVGIIKVVLVDTYSSEALITQLEPGESVKIGDVATVEPFSIAYTPPLKMPEAEPAEKEPVVDSGSYLEELKKHVKIATFKSGPKGYVKIGAGEASLLLNALGVGTYVPYTDPWMLVSVGVSLLNQYKTTRQMGPQNSVTLAICYYDDKLIEAQARYFASKEGITDEAQIVEIKNGLIQQLGADNSNVFHVKASNGGSEVVQLAPFKWHMFLMSSAGQKVSASRYDEALDKGIGPGSEAQGYVYFPKYDEARIPTGGEIVRISLESILGGNTDLIWK